MDPRLNPYAPGAGSPPPLLAGRSAVLERADVAIDRIAASRSARSFVFYGLRGVGKTVLLNQIARNAETKGFFPVQIEAREDKALATVLVPAIHSALVRISLKVAASNFLQAARDRLVSFARAFKVSYEGVDVSVDLSPASGDLEHDLSELFVEIGKACRAREKAIVLTIDELQYIDKTTFAALIGALHKVSQEKLPLVAVAAGLPQLVGQAGDAKSYAERLFEFVSIGPLDRESAKIALSRPAEIENVAFDPEALDRVIDDTRGYPYFLQEWGKHCWNCAPASPIRKDDAVDANKAALAELDASFFRVRFDRLTPQERNYLRAMAELGPGPHRSGEIAALLGREVTNVAPLRGGLIRKGMIFGPSHGETAFTVPLFDEFMRRTMAMPAT
jgi:hypothetical protein